ncbi:MULTISPECIES: zinc-dependent alcohol dehydrogenase [Brachybacterium]|uniref:Zinc-binding alcohol dehydrogenase n=1 Tax=Brachybacterium alimentarium TaxID=47845 RepID=A0A2A3YFH5_9MICO|nr:MULTISPECIES: alcohol dehydrogenase catalytic domain-containing protein [Brachybacterium]PCC32438.1 zinc-binding alcohol dehydrogenase [Brachybacterium alimentarium]PCC37989.1 zinc-binding alcohol dehydrogenase [Brachybacterium alimentarium]RCS62585.1 zinc-binding alcohol dehydrogenase [Brachybacterium sp. JB7]RCS71669.1 zinc-binding alcohol dehydrogenase [Brachybacterium alimentarium]RCS74383.1 zinc-binding alcohol dehydrogenase [Brachybacterium alimentarium]
MRALVLTDFHRLDVVDRPRPEPGPGEVLLRISATGICGSDVHGYTGDNGRRVPGQIMGHESSGTIAALGEGVDPSALPVGAPATFNPVVVPPEQAETFLGREQHAPGKQVIGVAQEVQASFADYVIVPARNVLLLDPELPLHLGALIEPLAVAVHAVGLGRPAPEEKVLVIGGGPIGQSVVIALQRAGVRDIVLSERDPARRELVTALGVVALDPTSAPLAELVVEALGAPADLAIDAVGLSPTMSDALTATALGGRVVLVGMGSPRLELPAFAISTEERSIVGSFTYSAQDFADASAWIGAHAEQVAPLVSALVPPEEAQESFAALAAGQGPAGKILVRFDQEDQPA